MHGEQFYRILVLTIFQAYCHIAFSYHFERCELAKELIQKHRVSPSQINDCKLVLKIYLD